MKTIKNTSNYKRNLNDYISCTFNHPTLGEIPNGLNPELDAKLIAEIEAAGLVEELTQAEKAAHELAQAAELKNSKIREVEQTITPRRMREAALGDAESIAFIQNADDEIKLLRE